MRSPLRPFPPRRFAAFTLTELLVVVAIIAVLASIALPVIGSMINRSRKVQVVADIRSIKTAVIAFYSDYRKYPLCADQINAGTSSYGGSDTVFGNPDHPIYQSSDLFNTLRAVAEGDNAGNAVNPNANVYWNGNFAKSATAPREGITTQDIQVNGSPITKGGFVDPWGHAYIVWFDACPDGDMTTCVGWFYSDMSSYASSLNLGSAPMGVLIGSLGPDGKWGTKGNGKLLKSDDIVSWQ